ncbi:hypothetical protein ACFSKL_17490 [Belliella marina]|uniref:Beta/gamma crystallin 'Greek key' domain-containing protein n=1 Tax=Belliella marina TaxID=1644146 RepID=A0ABW4VP90_9BACT
MKNLKNWIYVGLFLGMACAPIDDNPQIIQEPDPEPGFIVNEHNLNVVYFVPNDNPEVPGYRERLHDMLVYFQEFVGDEMDRNGFGYKSFGLAWDTLDNQNRVDIITIQGEHDQATYDYGSGSAILGEIAAYKNAHPDRFSSQHMLILLPQRTDGGSQPFYGLGRNCFAVDNPNIKVSEIPTTTSNLIGGMIHELGHGLGLPHNKGTRSERQEFGTSLMGAGNTTFGRSPTFISKAECAILNRNQIFESESIPDIYGGATTTVTPSVSYDGSSNTLTLTAEFTSNKTLSDVLVWLDPNVDNEGVGANRDYNSVAWYVGNPGGNQFSTSFEFGEIEDHGDWPYEMRVRLLMENGTINTHSYSFKFNNGNFETDSGVMVYQHSNYNGWGVELSPGSYTTADLVALGVTDNDISSIKVPLGLKATLYAGDDFTGQAFDAGAGNIWFLSSFNDMTSSIVVSEQ